MTLPTLAMCVCVRDEAAFLPFHLAYHHALGVGKAYIFLDRCRDQSREIAGSFPWVTTIPMDRDPSREQLPLYQNRCANQALELARRDGIDWLLHIDIDEFAWAGNKPEELPLRERGHLPTMLTSVPDEIEMVAMRTKEIVPQVLKPGEPFWKLQWVQDDETLARPVLDPTTETIQVLSRWIGHRLGKSIVRTKADVQSATPNVWTRRQGVVLPRPLPIATVERGWHYHYVIVDAGHWQSKFRKLTTCPNSWPEGQPAPFPKQAWKDASLEMTSQEAREYFARWVAVSEETLRSAAELKLIYRESVVGELIGQLLPEIRSVVRRTAA